MIDFYPFKGKNIIVSPLDWGLGHASRMVPIINYLSKNNKVLVVCGPNAMRFLMSEIQNVEIIKIDDIPIVYPKNKISIFTILKWIPIVFFNSIREHFFVKKIIKQRKIDAVFSDNRYGLLFKNIECYIFTHQIFPKLPKGFKLLENIVSFISYHYLSLFKKCFIPDYEKGYSLSGTLASDKINNPNKFVRIGILSRFSSYNNSIFIKKYDYLVLISGQEKLRTEFENQLLAKFKTSNKKILFVRGIPLESPKIENFNNIEFINMLTGNELAKAILSSKIVVCRSGYSTILDLVSLRAQAILIPTPGQTEQEYLAKRLNYKLEF
ncbi:MAG: hypothetical protein MJ211_15895 [Bacteroidales bacterium]|nr:hypothetical protein [Bacteroidales bacterium]